MNKRQLSKLKKENILQYVVWHGEWRLARGKRLSAILPRPYVILNPEKAFKVAKEMLEDLSKPTKRRSVFNFRGQTPLEEMLGVQPPNEPPWPGARKVPHTTNWY